MELLSFQTRVMSAATWDNELAAYQRGEFLQLVLSIGESRMRMRYMLQQWFVARSDIHRARPGAARAFATEESAHAFVARHHATLISWALPGVEEPKVVAVWRSL